MKTPAINISNYCFAIDGTAILQDISITVEAGDYLSVIGPNGAGKTTLLKCIDRIYRGGTGTINIDGRPLATFTQKELAREVSYVPQAGGRMAPFTVHQFVLMGRYAHMSPFSSPTHEDHKAVDDALAMTGTAEFKDRFLGTLSGGERQNVYIAAALAQGTNIMLLDEPTSFLDPKHEADVLALLAKINRERKTTIVAVTHHINSAAVTSDRILALKHGSIAFCGTPGEMMNNDVLQQIYDRTFTFATHPTTGKAVVVPETP